MLKTKIGLCANLPCNDRSGAPVTARTSGEETRPRLGGTPEGLNAERRMSCEADRRQPSASTLRCSVRNLVSRGGTWLQKRS